MKKKKLKNLGIPKLEDSYAKRVKSNKGFKMSLKPKINYGELLNYNEIKQNENK